MRKTFYKQIIALSPFGILGWPLQSAAAPANSYDINVDSGVIQPRRIIDRLYAEEQEAAARVAAAE